MPDTPNLQSWQDCKTGCIRKRLYGWLAEGLKVSGIWVSGYL